jgi:hypothetical protein|tara:strand:+ start:129 stop:347 length:219 start_codon:yes stop_codon:yes gene_type:complete
VKYFILLLILSSCSFDKNSAYWNEDNKKKSADSKEIIKILEKKTDFKTMTFDEFNLFLKDYSDKADFPDINN